MPVVIIALSIISVFSVTAFLIAPGAASGAPGQGGSHELRPARSERNQMILDGLATLLGSSAQIIAVHQRGEGPYTEVLLRTHAEEDGELAVEEIALISHSEILQTITLFTVAEAESSGSLRQTAFWGWPEPSERAFADRWRSHPRVRGRIIATGVSNMQLDAVTRAVERGSGSRGRAKLRISLTWALESTDGGDEASAVVDVQGF